MYKKTNLSLMAVDYYYQVIFFLNIPPWSPACVLFFYNFIHAFFRSALGFPQKNNIIKLHILIWFHFKQPDNVGIWHIPSLFTSKSRIWWHLSIIWGLAYLSWHPILLWTNYILSIRPFLTAGSHVYSLHSLPAPEWMHGGWYPFSLKSAGMRLQTRPL